MKVTFYIILLSLVALLNACNTANRMPNSIEELVEVQAPDQEAIEKLRLIERGQELAHKYIITDGHVDLPYRLRVQNFRLEKEFLEIPIQTDKGDFDYVRAREGGLDAPFMSIYLPADYQKDPGRSKILADSLIDMVVGITEKHPDKFEVAYYPDDLRRLFKKQKIALPMGMENGSGLEDDLKNVAYFAERGINYITLTHSKDNLICDSSYDTTRTWMGLSPFGYEVIQEMQQQGIMIDVSHISDSTFYQVMRKVDVPVIASHSSCRKFTPGFERNMSDDMIRKMGENGGIIMINFGSTFIDQKVKDDRAEMRIKLKELLESKGLTRDDEAAKPVIDVFNENNLTFSDVKVVADHIDHVVSLAGVDHVGFGSDYDGVGDSLPTGLKDVSDYPNLLTELLERGYSEKDIEKICSGNLLRVWGKVEAYAPGNGK